MGNSTITTKASSIHNLPERNHYFTGRKDELNQLSELIKSNKQVAIKQAIAGLGGMGKTQTAIEFCYKHFNDYKTILWVRAENQTDLNNSYLELGKLLKLISAQDIIEGLKVEQVVSLVKDWLSSSPNWLMVLDNLDDFEALVKSGLIKSYLPANHQGHILITTRDHDLGSFARTINLEKMDSATGALFLLRRCGLLQDTDSLDKAKESDRHLAKEIVKELDGLPLALDQAGAYIQHAKSSLDKYLSLYKDAKQAAKLRDRRGKNTDDHISVTATFSIAFDRVKQKSAVAADLLSACSLLFADSIPDELFTKAGHLLGDNLSTLVNDPLAWDDVVELLLGYSLIGRDINNQSLSIHRLVQAVIVDLMDDEARDYWGECLVNALYYLRPGDAEDPKYWGEYQRLLPSALALLKPSSAAASTTSTLTFLNAGYLFHDFGIYCDTQALYSQSLDFYQQSLSIYKHHFGDNHPDVAMTLNNIGEVYRNQGKYSEALDFFQQSLIISKQHFGHNHPDIASTLNNIALVYDNQEKYSEALDFFQQSLTIKKYHFGDNHPDVAQVLNNIAVVYGSQGKYSEALDFFQQSLTIKKHHFGDNHPDVAMTLNNIAAVYYSQGKYSEALDFFQQSLTIKKHHFGDNHPDVAMTLENLGYLYKATSKEQEAANYFEQALSIYDKVFPPNHPWIAQLLNNYSNLLLKLNRNDEAQILINRINKLNLSD